MLRLHKNSAESLIETLAAITVISLATVAAIWLIRNSLLGNQIIGEKVIATNLALEGIEVIKNVRDSNYLKFPSDPATCWDSVEAEVVADCGVDTLSDLGLVNVYRVFEPFSWEIVEVNLSDLEEAQLSLYELDHDDDAGTDPLELYAQAGLDSADTPGLDIEEVRANAFQRIISIVPSASDPDEAVDVTVTVEWIHAGNKHSVSLTRTLANLY